MIPSQTLLIPSFQGEAQGENTLTLPAVYSSGDSVDVYLDKKGKVRPIDGFTVKTTNPILLASTNIAAIRALHLYRKYASGSLTRQLIIAGWDANEFELFYSTDLGVTVTSIAALGSGSANSIPDFAMFGSILFFTNGVLTPRAWDGTTLSVAGGTQLGAPTVASGGAGLLKGVYKWRLVPVLNTGVMKIGSVASALLELENEDADLSWTADADTNVVGYNVFRPSGSGLDFYLVTYVSGRTTVAYTDNMPDTELITKPAMSIIAAHGDAPPSGAHFCVSHGGQMWYLRTDTFPLRAWWSDFGQPDSVYMDRSYLECADAKSFGDVLTGGTGDYEGMIVLWCNRSVWTVSGTGRVIGGVIDRRLKRSNARSGTVSHRTVAKVPQGFNYTDTVGEPQTTAGDMLVYLTPLKDIRLFDGNSDVIISLPVKDTLANINAAFAHTSFVYDDEKRGMLVWNFPIGSSETPNYAIGWNYWFGTWHPIDTASWGHVVTAESDADRQILLAGHASNASGKVYQLWAGDTFIGGGSISAQWVTVPIYPPIEAGGPPDLEHEKRFISATMLYDLDASPQDVSLYVLHPDWTNSDVVSSGRYLAVRLHSATGRQRIPTRVNATWKANALSLGGLTLELGQYVHANGVRLAIQSASTTGPWSLKGIELEYQVLPGRTR